MKKTMSYLVPVGLVIVSALVFAGWRASDMRSGLNHAWPELDGGVYAEAVTFEGVKYLVPPNEIYGSGLKPEDRPVLTDPKMVDIFTADVKLVDELEGIAVTVGNQQRFYPFQILNWHEIVHDSVGGSELVITYSPLTGSAVVYSAVADTATGERYHFDDAGQVYNNALLLKDGHGTLWNQTSGQAIVGETVGQRLTIYPSSVMSWAAWKDLHPDGLAMSTDTGYNRDYGRHPYANYETSKGIYFPLNHVIGNIAPKDIVYRVDAVTTTDEPVVFMARYLPAQENPNAELGHEDGQRSVVGVYDEDSKAVRVYSRLQAGRILTFEQRGGVLTDKETGSKWSASGLATSGELKGTQLTELPVTRHYAFAHFAMFPNSIVSGVELLPTEDVKPQGETLQIN